MAKTEIVLPAMGESISEATITQILIKVGDTVTEDDTLFEIATDKVDSEINSPQSGTILQILTNEGDTVPIGATIAIIGDENDKGDISESTMNTSVQKQDIKLTSDTSIQLLVDNKSTTANKQETITSDGFLSPLVKEIIKKENISSDEFKSIQGTGEAHRITKKDLFDFLSTRGKKEITKAIPTNIPVSKPISTPKSKPTNTYSGDNVEIIEMDRMRKLIANHMLESKRTSPHVTSFIDVDVTGLVTWRNKIKNKYLESDGLKISFTPIFIEAVSKALKDFPLINVSVDGDRIIRKKNINIGMATALPNGNLIVPVIKNADEKSLLGLARTVNDLAIRGRGNKLKPDEIQGGTFTITNLGNFGSITGTPIINQPEVAILAIGAIKKKPAVIETPLGDTIGIRHIMILSLAYDHRVVDGALGGMFLKRIAENLENIGTDKEI